MIAAMTKQYEQGCDFCNGSAGIEEDGFLMSVDHAISMSGKIIPTLSIDFANGKCDAGCFVFIKYCPLCGRKLV